MMKKAGASGKEGKTSLTMGFTENGVRRISGWIHIPKCRIQGESVRGVSRLGLVVNYVYRRKNAHRKQKRVLTSFCRT